MGANEIDQTSCFTFYFAKFIYNLQLMLNMFGSRSISRTVHGEIVAQAESRRAGDQLKQTVLLEQMHRYYMYLHI